MSGSFFFNHLLEEHPLFLFYLAGLLLAGLFSTGLLWLFFWSKPEWRRAKVTAWSIPFYDFGQFLFTYFITYLVLQLAAVSLLRDVCGCADSLVGILSSIILQAGFIVVFFYFRLVQWRLFSKPVNQQPVSWALSAALGLGFFLSSFPLIALIGHGWFALLDLLQRQGLPISLESQSIVTTFLREDDPMLFALLLFMAVIMAPLSEELLFRAGIYRFCRGRLSIPWAILVTSSLFAFLHQNLLAFPSLFLVGVFLCLVYEVSGNIQTAIAFHAFFNLNSIVLLHLLPEEMHWGGGGLL